MATSCSRWLQLCEAYRNYRMRDNSLFLKLTSSLKQGNWAECSQLVRVASGERRHGMIQKVLLLALSDQQWEAVGRLAAMHIVTLTDVDSLTGEENADAWSVLSSLLCLHAPEEVTDYLTEHWTRHALITVFAEELSRCLNKKDQRDLLRVFLRLLVEEGVEYYDALSKALHRIHASDQAAHQKNQGFNSPFKAVFRTVNAFRDVLLMKNPIQLEELWHFMDQRGSEECLYFAAYVASFLGRWDYLCELVGERGFVILCGGRFFFKKAVQGRAWDFAATLLNSLLLYQIKWDRDPTEFWEIAQLCYKWDKRFPSKKQVMECFGESCCRLKMPAAGASSAIWLGHLSTAKAFMNQPDVANLYYEKLVNSICWRNRVPLLAYADFVEFWPAYSLTEDVVRHACWRLTECRALEAVEVIRRFLPVIHMRYGQIARVILSTILEERLDQHFRLFLSHQFHLRVRPSGQKNMAGNMVMEIMVYERIPEGGDLPSDPRDREILQLAVQAGLTMSMYDIDTLESWHVQGRVNILDLAVSRGQLKMVTLLYLTGAASNGDMHRICSTFVAARFPKVQSYIQHASSNAKSLCDLSALVVSRCIGCGSDRKHRALQLELPINLVEKVLFYDIL